VPHCAHAAHIVDEVILCRRSYLLIHTRGPLRDVAELSQMVR